MRRFVKWRLGELHYFLGELDHDATQLREARGFWRDAAAFPWERGSARRIPRQVIIRNNILQLGRQQPHAGVGLAHAGLARLQAPATNLKIAAEVYASALTLLGDGSRAWHDDVPPARGLESRAIALLDLGTTLTALGATVDSLATVERGLARLREAAALAGLRDGGSRSDLCEETGVAFLRRARLPAAPAARADLDSAQAWLDRASALRGRTSGRGCWNLCRARSGVYEAKAELAGSPPERQALLRRAREEMEKSIASLGGAEDDFEREISRCDLAALTAGSAALAADKSLFARADSLLAVGTIFADSTPYPLQYAGRELRRAQVCRLRWEAFGDPADSARAATALARGGEAVAPREFPAMHRAIAGQARALTIPRAGPR